MWKSRSAIAHMKDAFHKQWNDKQEHIDTLKETAAATVVSKRDFLVNVDLENHLASTSKPTTVDEHRNHRKIRDQMLSNVTDAVQALTCIKDSPRALDDEELTAFLISWGEIFKDCEQFIASGKEMCQALKSQVSGDAVLSQETISLCASRLRQAKALKAFLDDEMNDERDRRLTFIRTEMSAIQKREAEFVSQGASPSKVGEFKNLLDAKASKSMEAQEIEKDKSDALFSASVMQGLKSHFEPFPKRRKLFGVF